MQLNIRKQVQQGRKWHRWTQTDLADKAGCSTGTVFRFEAGEDVGFNKVLSMVDALGCDLAIINTHSTKGA